MVLCIPIKIKINFQANLIDGTLTSTTNPSQSGLESNGIEEVLITL